MAMTHAAPTYRRRQIAKQNKASRTPGKLKGESCQTDPVKRFFASSPKAYRHPQYNEWNEHFKLINKVK